MECQNQSLFAIRYSPFAFPSHRPDFDQIIEFRSKAKALFAPCPPAVLCDVAVGTLRFATHSAHIGRTSTTSGTKCRSRFWMPCCSVAVDDGQPAQEPFMLR